MNPDTKTACVTGATGMIGRRIVERLLTDGFHVRALTRNGRFDDPQVQVFKGGLEDEETLKAFLKGGHLIFHCAGEIHDESKMRQVNVLGTKGLLNLAKDLKIIYFCYISSAGVTGLSKRKMVTEQTKCFPMNLYEQTKWEAERLVENSFQPSTRTIILRPTNVVDAGYSPGLDTILKPSLLNRLKIFLKGGESAHIVHARDVASAALFFLNKESVANGSFLVSRDHEPFNTFAGLRAACNALKNRLPWDGVRPAPHLPLMFPYVIRFVKYRGKTNFGDIQYSSEKLISEGFVFSFKFKDMVSDLMKQSKIK